MTNFVFRLFVDFVLGNEVAFGVKSTDNVFVTLEGEVRGFAIGRGILHGERTVFVLHRSDRIALFVLLVVGVIRSKRIGTRPKFDRIEDQPVHKTQADRINRDDPDEEVDSGIEPLVAQSAVPAEELFSEAIATMAAGEDENTCAKQSDNCFFHIYKLLIFK